MMARAIETNKWFSFLFLALFFKTEENIFSVSANYDCRICIRNTENVFYFSNIPEFCFTLPVQIVLALFFLLWRRWLFLRFPHNDATEHFVCHCANTICPWDKLFSFLCFSTLAKLLFKGKTKRTPQEKIYCVHCTQLNNSVFLKQLSQHEIRTKKWSPQLHCVVVFPMHAVNVIIPHQQLTKLPKLQIVILQILSYNWTEAIAKKRVVLPSRLQ